MLCPNLPEQLDHVIQKATAKHPDDRFQDVIALAEAFQDAIRPKTRFLSQTSALDEPVVKAAGNLNALIYTRPEAVLENPTSTHRA